MLIGVPRKLKTTSTASAWPQPVFARRWLTVMRCWSKVMPGQGSAHQTTSIAQSAPTLSMTQLRSLPRPR